MNGVEGPGGYSSYPAGPMPTPDEGSAEHGGPQRPQLVLAGVVLTYVGAGLVLALSLLVLLAIVPADPVTLQRFIVGMGLDATPGALRAGAIGAGIGLFVQGILLVVGAVLAQQGRNAGRILLTVLGGLNIVLNLTQLAAGRAIGLPILLYTAAVVVCLWVGQANAWFCSQRARRVHDRGRGPTAR